MCIIIILPGWGSKVPYFETSPYTSLSNRGTARFLQTLHISFKWRNSQILAKNGLVLAVIFKNTVKTSYYHDITEILIE